MAASIREAIDERYGAGSREDRRRAVEEIAGMEGEYADPAELARMIDEERDEVARGLDLPQPGRGRGGGINQEAVADGRADGTTSTACLEEVWYLETTFDSIGGLRRVDPGDEAKVGALLSST